LRFGAPERAQVQQPRSLRTRAYYDLVLARSRVLTPNPLVNRGVLWAKANMLRVMLESPTGWCAVNDPSHSNNSVGRDTAWFAFGADYLVPDFARESLLAYVRLQQKSGMVVEYYDIRNERTADYGLNINDNTPLLVLALWHHFSVTGDHSFLEQTYPAAKKAVDYILSQRNADGLVWCTATGTANQGIIGWRNVIPDYRLSGATTEVNSECYAALDTVSHMARTLGKHSESSRYAAEAAKLREAINTHLRNPGNGLYYLSIDIDGQPRSDVTSDLVFPVMFGVAPDDVAANIIARLSDRDFWTEAGIRTTPRDAPNYTPNGGWGLLGGVWLGVTFWYARAAAKYQPTFMDHALATSFRNYTRDPKKKQHRPGSVLGVAARRDARERRDDAVAMGPAPVSQCRDRRCRRIAARGRQRSLLATSGPRLEVDGGAGSPVPRASHHLVRRARPGAADVHELPVSGVIPVPGLRRGHLSKRPCDRRQRRIARLAPGRGSAALRREHRGPHHDGRALARCRRQGRLPLAGLRQPHRTLAGDR